MEYAHLAGVEVRGVVESGQGTSMSTLEILRGMGIDVIPDGNPGNLHHKFVVIDAGTPNAKVITGSYNWTPNALNVNDENFLVIHSSAMADLFWQEFQKNYSIASGSLYVRDEPAIGNLLVYPSPAKFTDDLSVEYRLSCMVQEVSATIFTLSGAEVVTINPSFYPGSDNKFIWDMKNKAGHDIAPGLYFIRLEVKTGDGKFSSMDKFAVIR